MVNTDCTSVWLNAVSNLLQCGRVSSPRGLSTRELLHRTFIIDMTRPVLTCPLRKLSYRFMAAEAYWILTGDNTVSGIAPYNSHIAEFSDDGTKFAGAYGPRIKEQFDWVLNKLIQERGTRQAGLTIWKDTPAPSRDIPCTVAIWFSVRGNMLNTHVFMRSSDVWLGLPYDIFNFSMLGWLMAGRLNQASEGLKLIFPGSLYLTAVSSHLYDVNEEDATLIEMASIDERFTQQGRVPLFYLTHPDELVELLKDLREREHAGKRWW